MALLLRRATNLQLLQDEWAELLHLGSERR